MAQQPKTSPTNAVGDDNKSEKMRERLLDWYRVNKRDLPWRGADAYGVWVSEIMLQQTLVATVIPYYLRFMQRFPTVNALAEAELDDVLQFWAGLGYYARARNLHKAARTIVESYAGRVPESEIEIRKLPGIGAYTSGAILSIAYDRPLPAIDANVIRVLCRLYGLPGDPKSSAAHQTITEAAVRLVPQANPGEFNQALMELGALVCDIADPRCEQCPVLPCCAAGNSTNPIAFPEYPVSKASISLVHSCVVIHNSAGGLLILQRPPHGLWGGLWEFPRVVCGSGESPEAGARRAAHEIAGIALTSTSMVKLTTVKHTVTKYKITLHAFVAVLDEAGLDEPTGALGIGDALRWVTPERLNEYAFSSPQSLVRAALAQRQITFPETNLL